MVIESDSLIRLGKKDAPSLAAKNAEKLSLSESIERFLAEGGKIEHIETGVSGEPFIPKRTKDRHDAELRRRSWNRSQVGK